MSTKIKINNEWIDVATNSVSDSVRNPDWSRTTQLTNAQFTSNTYRFPEDGIFINASLTKNTTQWCNCLINGTSVGVVRIGEDFNVCVPVCAGDLLTSAWDSGSDKLFQEVRLYFVPYKISKVDNTVPSLAGTYSNVVHFFTFKQGVGARATTGAIPLLQYNRYNLTINSAEMYLPSGWTNIKTYLSLANNGGFYDLMFDWQGSGVVTSDLAGEWGATRISYTVTDR